MLHRSSDRHLTDIIDLMFDTFGKRVYGDKNPHNVRRRFNLTNAKLRDILHATETDAPLADIDPELCCPNGNPLEPISDRRLWKYLLLCRIARCAIEQRGHDPDIFASLDTMELAKQLRQKPAITAAAAA